MQIFLASVENYTYLCIEQLTTKHHENKKTRYEDAYKLYKELKNEKD